MVVAVRGGFLFLTGWFLIKLKSVGFSIYRGLQIGFGVQDTGETGVQDVFHPLWVGLCHARHGLRPLSSQSFSVIPNGISGNTGFFAVCHVVLERIGMAI